MSSIITNLVVHKVIYNLVNWKLENVGGGGGGGGGRGHDKDVIWSGSSEK